MYIYIYLAFELSISPYSFLNGNVTFAFYSDHDHFCYCLPNSSLWSCWATTIFAFPTARCVSLLVDFSNKLVPGCCCWVNSSFWAVLMDKHVVSCYIHLYPAKDIVFICGVATCCNKSKGSKPTYASYMEMIEGSLWFMLCWQADSYLSDSVILRSPDGTMRLGYKWGWIYGTSLYIL